MPEALLQCCWRRVSCSALKRVRNCGNFFVADLQLILRLDQRIRSRTCAGFRPATPPAPRAVSRVGRRSCAPRPRSRAPHGLAAASASSAATIARRFRSPVTRRTSRALPFSSRRSSRSSPSLMCVTACSALPRGASPASRTVSRSDPIGQARHQRQRRRRRPRRRRAARRHVHPRSPDAGASTDGGDGSRVRCPARPRSAGWRRGDGHLKSAHPRQRPTSSRDGASWRRGRLRRDRRRHARRQVIPEQRRRLGNIDLRVRPTSSRADRATARGTGSQPARCGAEASGRVPSAMSTSSSRVQVHDLRRSPPSSFFRFPSA